MNLIAPKPFVITASPGWVILAYDNEVRCEQRVHSAIDARHLAALLKEMHPNIPQIHRGFSLEAN